LASVIDDVTGELKTAGINVTFNELIIQFDWGVTQSHCLAVLTFVETTTFTQLITDLVSDDDYAKFQNELADNPEKGGPMSGCGGVRKARMALPGMGKSGGARVVYLYLHDRGTIYLIYVFTKGAAENLSAAGKKAKSSRGGFYACRGSRPHAGAARCAAGFRAVG